MLVFNRAKNWLRVGTFEDRQGFPANSPVYEAIAIGRLAGVIVTKAASLLDHFDVL